MMLVGMAATIRVGFKKGVDAGTELGCCFAHGTEVVMDLSYTETTWRSHCLNRKSE